MKTKYTQTKREKTIVLEIKLSWYELQALRKAAAKAEANDAEWQQFEEFLDAALEDCDEC